MAGEWVPIPIDAKLYLNLDETQLRRAQAAVENGYINEAGGHTRFPGLKDFADLGDEGRAYGFEWRGDMIVATSNGLVYRIDESANVENVTAEPVSGGGRVIFAKTQDEVLMAAGQRITRFDGYRTELLSEDAPLSSHVAFLDNYVLASEKDSGRFQHADAGDPPTWDPLSTFAVDSKPDNVTALLVTPFGELLLFGPDSAEQFERLSTGDVPFFRRWRVGEGLLMPYALTFADNAAFLVNNRLEVVRLSGQTSEPIGTDIGKALAGVDDWRDAWMGGYPDQPLIFDGQAFILLQVPFATTPYGTRGRTFLFDLRGRQWSELYGWDAGLGVPARWPGWSHWTMWRGRTFVGGEGKVYETDRASHVTAGQVQRWMLRTAHLSEAGEVEMSDSRIRIKRGVGSYTANPVLRIRCRRDNKPWTRWKQVSLGRTGETYMTKHLGGWGSGNSLQFEIEATDDADIELVKFEGQIARVGF